jgi:photosystem II stability/assembly factor-like uncharacterized protein
MRHRYRLSVLLVVAVLSSAASVRAQLVWEPANRGTEGGYPRTFFETRAGTLLAASERAIYRFDATTASWTRSLTIREPWGSTVPTFGGDGTGAVIAASSTGVLRSTDDGATWTRIDSSANEIVADDRGMVVLLRHQEISRDLGETWEWRPRHSHVEALDGGLLIAAERTVLFVSDDTGRTWRERTVFGDEVRSLEVVDGSTIYAGTHAGLYRSTDAGARWQQLATFPVTEVAAISGGRIAVASYVWNSATPNDAFYNSTDGGATWRRRLDGAPDVARGARKR